jgi:predicted O-methyltransferase YrrM
MPIEPKIQALIDELDELAKTRDDAWQVPRDEGMILHHIALSTGARVIVEIGTSYGFSGLHWAAALKRTGGMLHTIDRDPKKVASSEQTFARAGVGDLVLNHLGDARQALTKLLPTVTVDLAFIDADKPATAEYFRMIWPRIRVGGSVLIDNATTHREQLAPLVHEIRARPDAIGSEIAVGNGLEWILKIA